MQCIGFDGKGSHHEVCRNMEGVAKDFFCDVSSLNLTSNECVVAL